MAKRNSVDLTAKRETAYAMFLLGTLTNRAIAQAVGVAPNTLAKWAEDGNWHVERQSLAVEEMESIRASMRRVMIENRIKVAERHLEAAQEIDEAVRFALQKRSERKEEMPSGMLRDYSMALKNSADVASRAAGLSERSLQVAAFEEEKKNDGPPVSLHFQVQGGLMPQQARSDRGEIQDITKDIEVLPPGRGGSTSQQPPPSSSEHEASSHPEPVCPF